MTNETLIDQLLSEQRSLTAVERFAQKHERGEFHALARYYEDLIPLSKPAKGEQYAFAVNLDKCSGCKACVSACHSLNGLEEHETWRDVGLLIGGSEGTSYQQTVTTACHHCADPACLNGCPVGAYDKDVETGIVRHLDDQCIGCQYCTMKCPYDVPKYSKRLGIVRKCDMCYDRLAVGEAPACVQACPHEAIEIRLVNVSEVRAATAPGTQLLPGTFDSSYTHPTTSYTTTKKMPVDTKSADAEALHLEHPHWPLIVMLVLTQMAVGLTLALAGLSINPEIYSVVGFPLAAGSFTILNVGLIAAIFHLGRPLGAWRFFLGLRTSWMSREILAFCVFAAAAGANILPAFLAHPLATKVIPASWLSVIQPWIGLTALGLSSVAALFGLIAVFTSGMIYIDTRRPFWRASLTLPRFFGATLTLGAGATTVVFASVLPSAVATTAWVSLAFLCITFAWEMIRHITSLNDSDDPSHDSARTLERLLPWWIPIRGGLFIASSAILILTGTSDAPLPFAIAALTFLLIAQVLERFAYFTTVIAPRMPRGI
jgi:Fe-S-cluster-containing dehydrogenase component/DMSO reductase anchor subunit